MAVQHGYGKIAGADALVFAYDTGDTRNSYKGKPATNLLTTISKGNTNTPLFRIIPGQEVKNVPGMGKRTVEYVDIYNDYNGGSANCCPAPMFFGDFTVSPSTVYTYQIVYKTATGYAHPNYMYHYEYNGGTYVTEYGLWNSGRIQDLGNGWKHAWGTFTSNASTNRFICSLFHYEYATENRIEVAGVMLTQGNSIIPPPQFLSVNTTRSATQGLLDLTGNRTIDLTNVKFDANAQPVFDGTNDTITVGTGILSGTGDFTVEAVIQSDYQEVNGTIFANYPAGNLQTFFSGRYIGLYLANNSAYLGSSPFTTVLPEFTTNPIHFLALREGTETRVYLNGVLKKTGSSSSTIGDTSAAFRVGTNTNGIEDFLGNIFVVKAYNRALTAAEVANNYNHYKGRFNI
jgi:hypothetical protein